MQLEGRENWLWSLVCGIVVTLVSSLIPIRTLMGATHYGFPLQWLIKLVLAAGYNPWRLVPLYFVIDTVLWSIIIYAVTRWFAGSCRRCSGYGK